MNTTTPPTDVVLAWTLTTSTSAHPSHTWKQRTTFALLGRTVYVRVVSFFDLSLSHLVHSTVTQGNSAAYLPLPTRLQLSASNQSNTSGSLKI